MERLRTALEQSGVLTETDCLLSHHSTFRIGGIADLAIFPKNAQELIETIRLCRKSETRTAVIGNGSNVLFADEGFRGAVVFTRRMRDFSDEPNGFRASCGTSLATLANAARRRELTGFEFAWGIPASMGGAVCMNAGAHGGEMSQIVTETECYDPDRDTCLTLCGEEHEFGYRASIYEKFPQLILLSARVVLQKGDRNEIDAKMKSILAKRRATQPLDLPSAGSAFKRPKGLSAAKLIEDCGLKGCHIGGAEVSKKHAGFIVNRGGATASDVLALTEHIQETVFQKMGVMLEPEFRVIR